MAADSFIGAAALDSIIGAAADPSAAAAARAQNGATTPARGPQQLVCVEGVQIVAPAARLLPFGNEKTFKVGAALFCRVIYRSGAYTPWQEVHSWILTCAMRRTAQWALMLILPCTPLDTPVPTRAVAGGRVLCQCHHKRGCVSGPGR